MRETGLNRTAG